MEAYAGREELARDRELITRLRKEMESGNAHPDVECVNCGSTAWEADLYPEWYCFICGNRGFWRNGEFIQTKMPARQ